MKSYRVELPKAAATLIAAGIKNSDLISITFNCYSTPSAHVKPEALVVAFRKLNLKPSSVTLKPIKEFIEAGFVHNGLRIFALEKRAGQFDSLTVEERRIAQSRGLLPAPVNRLESPCEI